MQNNIKEQIAIEVIRTISTRFESFPDSSSSIRNAPFHKAFLNAFENNFDKINTSYFVALSSWFHGLNTTLGQSFFENIAHILCEGSKKSYIGDNRLPLRQYQIGRITEIITDLKNSLYPPNSRKEEELIFELIDDIEGKGIDFIADVYFETANEIVCIELKSVKPNAGEIRGEKTKFLQAKASLKNKFPEKNISVFFGFPFDPTGISDYDYDKSRFLSNIVDGKKYLDESEILLGPELWDFLSGEENTMENIINIINDIATTDFIRNREYINNIDNYLNFDNDEYNSLLAKWHLYTELNFRCNENFSNILLSKNKNIQKLLNQEIIRTNVSNYGEYNLLRILKLNEKFNDKN